MRYQQKIYNQSGNLSKNKDSLNVNMSSDICIFSAPTFNISGATKINTGTTSASTGVYIINGDSEMIDLSISFTGNVSSFNSESIFIYEIYKFDDTNKIFNNSPIIKSDNITYPTFSASSIIDLSLSTNKLNYDGEYLIKGYYTHEICTNILGKLNLVNDTSLYKNGSEYGLYNPSTDYVFTVIKNADIPIFTTTVGTNNRPIGSLVAKSVLPSDGETEIPLTIDVNGELLIYLNGILLSDELDYVIENDIINLSGETLSGDVITYVAVSDSSSNGLVVDSLEVSSPIVSGTTNSEGVNKYFYNLDYEKYEIYTKLTPINGNDIIITLNGTTLAPNIDYYQSISNTNRIILEGNLLDGDIINIIYNAFPSYVGEIYTNKPVIMWTIPAPKLDNGLFTVEVATDSTFNTIVSTGQTTYITNEVSYFSEVILSGSVGTNLVYRVLNEKNYKTLDGDIITTSAYSEVVPITIMSNSINSY